jgi:hypothetical protein
MAGPSSATLVPVVFELTKHCPFGQAFALVGDDPHLGEWDVSKALRLEVRGETESQTSCRILP